MKIAKSKAQNVSKALAQLLPTDDASHANLSNLLERWRERYSRTSTAEHT